MTTGLQDGFDWRSVAVAAVAAGISSSLAPAARDTATKAFGSTFAGTTASRVVSGRVSQSVRMLVYRQGRIDYAAVAADAFGSALGDSLAEAMQPTQGEGPWSAADYRNGSDIESDNYSSERARSEALYGLASGGPVRFGNGSVAPAAEPFIDSDNYDLMGTPRQVGVVGKDGARGAWGIAQSLADSGASNADVNRIKNQLLALNPELADGVQKGQRYHVPDASTPENLALARSADRQYQVALAARSQAPSVAWGEVQSFGGDGTSFSELAALGGGSPSLGAATSLSGMERAQAHALGVYDAGVGAVEGAGYSVGVVGTPESRAAWAVKTAEATVEGIKRFANDPKGVVSGWCDNLTGDDPEAIRQATAQGAGVAIGVAGGVATGRLQGGLRVGTAAEMDMFRRVANQGAFADLPVLMDLKTVRSYASEAGIGLDGVKVRIVRDESLIGRGIGGYTHPNGKAIDLYPDAFSSPEELVRTIAHERMHVYQARTFGESTGQIDLRINENAAYGLEDSFVQYWRLNKGR